MSLSSTTPSIPFGGTVTRAEFARIQTLLLPAWARWYVMYLCLGVILLATSLPHATWSGLATTALFAVGFVVAMALFTKRTQARTWKRVVALNGRVHGAIGPAGLEWNTANAQSRLEWARIAKIAHGRDLTLAFYAPRCAFFFPRSFFESEQAWHAFNAAIDAYAPA